MENENSLIGYLIEIEGEEISDIYNDLIDCEVELDNGLAGMFRLRIAISLGTDGVWKYIDDERFTVWKQVTVRAGFGDVMEEVITGYITHLRPVFEEGPMLGILEIWGMDGGVLMDRREIIKDWPNKKDSDIASEIFNAYGFTPEIEDTVVVHDEAVSTIIQRETDMRFLSRLALRNGFECYIEGNTGYFRSPVIDEAPQPVLAVHFGEETNVNRFSIEVNALAPANVEMFQIDRMNKEVMESVADASEQPPLGSINSSGILPPGINPAHIYIAKNVVTGNPEMSILCRGLFHQADYFVTGEGEILGNHYRHILKPRRTVTIKGVGEPYNGVYYVTHVTHSFSPGSYIQNFKVKRNGIMPTGSEDFSSSSG